MKKRILFIGTSHIGTFRSAWDPIEGSDEFEADFFGVPEPVWTGLLSNGSFQISDNKLLLPTQEEILSAFNFKLDAELKKSREYLLRSKYVFDANDNYSKIVLIDFDFHYRFPLWKNDDGIYMYDNAPVSLDLLLSLDRFAGNMHSHSGKYRQSGLTFKDDKEVSFISLIKLIRQLVPNVPIDLIREPFNMSSNIKRDKHNRIETQIISNKQLHDFAIKKSRGDEKTKMRNKIVKAVFDASVATSFECHQLCTDRLGLNIRHLPQPQETLDDTYAGTKDIFSVAYGDTGRLNRHCTPKYAEYYFKDILDV